jgi:PIN domain nuclease of toxin-antitoxin system
VTLAVLDASALLALLLDEPGGERVAAVLSESVINAVNLGEVVGHYARNGGVESDIRDILEPLPFAVYPFDHDIAFATGLLLPKTRTAGLGPQLLPIGAKLSKSFVTPAQAHRR